MWTFNPDDMTTDLNKVRRLIGDVSSTAPLFQDEEIDFFTSSETNVFGAASLACESLAGLYAAQVNKQVGPLRLDASQKYDHFRDLAGRYAVLAKSKGSPQIYAGGISVSDKDTQEADTDRDAPYFKRGWDDFAGTTLTSTE